MEKKLYRDEYRKKIAGVCAGLADYFNVDAAIVRLIFVLALIFHGGGLLVYIILWIVLPKKPYPYFNPTVDYTVPPQNPGAPDMNMNPPQGNPFSNEPFPNQPFPPRQRGTSLAAIIIGVVLIIVGGSILLDNFDLIPDWDIEHLWPVIPITVGCILMMSGEREKKKRAAEWQAANETKAADTTTENTTESNPPADNTPAE